MNLSKLLQNVDYSYQSFYSEDLDVSSITIDSRTATQGSVFVGIKGMDLDGHDYAYSAYCNGARAFIVEHRIYDMPDDCVIIRVDNTRDTLADISAEFYGHPDTQLKVIGITGTKGKTSTALMIRQVLELSGMPTGYIGTSGIDYGGIHYDTKNTTPESHDLHKYMRKMVDSGIKYVVLEVSSQALKVGRVLGIKFDTCIFTNLSRDHIGIKEHANFEEYRDCKRTLFKNYGAKTIIYNEDDPYSDYMIRGCSAKNLIAVSTDTDSQAQFIGTNLSTWRDKNHLGISYDCLADGKKIQLFLPFPGAFSMINSMIVIACCRTCGIDPYASAAILERVSLNGRFEVIPIPEKPNATFVIDYAHNGISMTSILTSLRPYIENKGRLICLFGSIGGRSFERRKELGDAAAEFADYCILTSDNPNNESPEQIIDDIADSFDNPEDTTFTPCEYVKIPDREKAIEYAVNFAGDGDIVIFAGKGHEKYQLINGVSKPFNERKLIEGYGHKLGGAKAKKSTVKSKK